MPRPSGDAENEGGAAPRETVAGALPASSSVEGDPYTRMAQSFGGLARVFGRRFFGGFGFDPGAVEVLRALDRRGSMVYVMRYSSRLDYFLFNWLFLAHGIRLSVFANGIRFYYYRPIRQALPMWLRHLFESVRGGRRARARRQTERLREVLRGGGSAFLFLRTAKIGMGLRSRRGAVISGRSELDYMREVVSTCFDESVPISLVPLALFWRKGIRRQRRFLNVFYGAIARPTDTGKILSFLWNYRNLAVRVGTPLDLGSFIEERRALGVERLVRQVRRALMIFLRREEKPVLGAALRVPERIEEMVLAQPDLRRVIEEVAVEERRSPARVEARARRYFREIAARPGAVALGLLDAIVGWIFARLFGRVDVFGLDRIVEAAKLHPLVLVPCHRSHFDYLILSWLFYERHLVPPHVAAGDNLSFWPLGPILRRAGGYFMRRSFDGEKLYTAVFRGYVRHLIKDGATQEFFIEGTRSRTGKTLTPRLGLLGMIVEAFASGVRKDLYIVPVGFTYERLVEERSIVEERRGARKTGENLLGLLRSRQVLRHRFGSVTVRFGEPLSLAEFSGSDSVMAGEGGRLDAAASRRKTVQLGDEICRRINALVTAGRSAVSSCALLADPGQGIREREFRERVEEVVALLHVLGTPVSEALERGIQSGRPEASLELLLQAHLVERKQSHVGPMIVLAAQVRDRLDYYRGTVAPSMVWPAVLALGLRNARTRALGLEEACSVLSLLRLEYFPPPLIEDRLKTLGQVLEHFVQRGWVSLDSGGGVEVRAAGLPWLRFFAVQIQPVLEAYAAFFRVVESLDGTGERRRLLDEAESLLEDELVLGEARYPEAVSRVTFGNALGLLHDESVLICEGALTRAETVFAPGPRWDRLPSLLGRVAATLSSG